MTYDDLWYSIRRTIVPLTVGWLLAQAARYGFDIPAEALTGVIEPVFAGSYYVVVRWIEMNHPKFGLFLGAMKQPHYLDVPVPLTARNTPPPLDREEKV